jgi:hypothetical protein
MLRTDHATPRMLGLAERFGSVPRSRVLRALLVAALLGVCVSVVYLAGGPPNPTVHLLYVPILVAAILFGTIGGLATGLVAGVLTGPWMAATGLAASGQTTAEWALRLAMLATVGTLVGAIQSLLRNRLGEVEELVGTLTETHAKTLSTFASTIELRDTFTGGHSNRVARNARAVAQGLDLDEAAIRWAYWSGLLHDLGKVAVPERILLKPGPLTPEETLVMRRHSRIGAELLEAVSSDFGPIADAVRAHHERWDGTGYPAELGGEEIPLVGRVLCVVDVFEALTCLRPYRGPSAPEEALEYLQAQSGRQFDPHIVEVFEGLFWTGEIFTAANPGPETIQDSIHGSNPDPGDRRSGRSVRELLAPDPLYHLANRP